MTFLLGSFSTLHSYTMMMRYSIFFCVVLFIFFSPMNAESSSGSAKKFGLGLSLFGPTGVSGKYHFDQKSSVEASIGFGTIGNGRTHLHAVYLYNAMEFSPALKLYVGGGGVFQERSSDGNSGKGRGFGNVFRDRSYESSFGLRAPIGLSFFTDDKRFELSGEVYMQLFLTSKNGADVGLAFAGRYYF